MSEAASLLARTLYVVKRYLQTVATGVMQLAAARSRRRRIVDLHHGAIRDRPRDVAIETGDHGAVGEGRALHHDRVDRVQDQRRRATCANGHAAHHGGVWLKGGRPWRSCAA